MKKSSEVLGLKVIGIKEGAEKGIAQDFMLDASSKLVKYLVIKTNNGYVFRVMLVSDVVSIGADYVTTSTMSNVKSLYESQELMEEVEKGFFILGATVLSSSGDIIGAVEDFYFDEKTGVLETIFLNDGSELPAASITTLADKIVFVENSDMPAAAPSTAAFEEPAAVEAELIEMETVAEPAVEAAVSEIPEVAAQVEVVAEPEPVAEEAPKRSALEEESIAFLLGKTVMSEVLSDDGLFRVEEGTVLTEEIIEQAEQHDAILTLTLSV